MTYFCYIDESGTPEVPGTSSHFVLVGLAIPIQEWAQADRAITALLQKFGLAGAEVHTAWMLRRLAEQDRIPNFDKMTRAARASASQRYRAGELLRLQKTNHKAYRQAKKNYAHTEAYTHLTLPERRRAIEELADLISGWGYAFLFAEAINKIHFDAARAKRTISEQAFEQLVTRFDTFLLKDCPEGTYGVLVHDNNQTIAKKHTDLMRQFHNQGTLWSRISRLAETPLFVDSKLTRMVQIADLCSYAIRRFAENGESDLFDRIFKRAHCHKDVVVGVRHYTDLGCVCKICAGHRKNRRKVEPKAA